MTPVPASDSLADKLAFLDRRAGRGTARAIELAALAAFAMAQGNVHKAWHWTCQGFRDDALHPHIEACLLGLAAHVPAEEAAPYLDLLLQYDRRPEVLVNVLKLRFGDRIEPIVARIHATAAGAEIWVACRTASPFALKARSDSGETTIFIAPSDGDTLAMAFGYAATVVVPWAPGTTFVDLEACGVEISWIRRSLQRPRTPTEMPNEAAGDGRTTVLIPVFGDATSLGACLASLFKDEEPASERRLILINDASPDPNVTSVLQEAAGQGAEVLLNARNIGFTASINRGLCYAGSGNVVLLNSDTVVAPRWLSRLKSVADSDATIGTVTPLTNNGESVSAPQAFRSNPVLPSDEIRKLNETLWTTYGREAVDIPAGIGFCLYISEAARRRGGLLDDLNFGRGYLEEVDFCLRIKAAGFRNVCAPGIYIGHKGEASFGLEKAYLVARNTRTLHLLHPQHEANYRQFALSDPLREIRAMCRRALAVAAS